MKKIVSDLDQYGRIFGGIAWPGLRPGFGVILGELKNIDENTGERMIHVLSEFESGDIPSLLKTAAAHDSYYFPDKWFGDPGQLAARSFIRALNDELTSRPNINERQKPLNISYAPFVGDESVFELYLTTIHNCLRPDAKILHFGRESVLPGYLMELTHEKVFKGTARDYPAVFALGAALVALTQKRKVNLRDLPAQAEMGEVKIG
jgi:hypothetical protein